MWKDPVVEETRKLREQYASKFKYDVDAIFDDIQRRQADLLQLLKNSLALSDRWVP
jgi:hypothetical protein